MYTSTEVARALRLHPNTVRRYLKTGRLKGVRFVPNGRWRVARAELKKFMEKQ